MDCARGASHPPALCAFRVARNDEVDRTGATKQLDGQINESMSSPPAENISLSRSGKSVV
jgi:hypothetical protein